MIHCVTIPADVNPALRPALNALAETLTDRHYSAHAASAILAYVATEGTLASAPGLDPEDEAAAEAAYVNALPAVPFGSPAWGAADGFDEAMERFERDNPVPHPLPVAFRPIGDRHDPDSLGRINAALYGTATPYHA